MLPYKFFRCITSCSRGTFVCWERTWLQDRVEKAGVPRWQGLYHLSRWSPYHSSAGSIQGWAICCMSSPLSSSFLNWDASVLSKQQCHDKLNVFLWLVGFWVDINRRMKVSEFSLMWGHWLNNYLCHIVQECCSLINIFEILVIFHALGKNARPNRITNDLRYILLFQCRFFFSAEKYLYPWWGCSADS